MTTKPTFGALLMVTSSIRALSLAAMFRTPYQQLEFPPQSIVRFRSFASVVFVAAEPICTMAWLESLKLVDAFRKVPELVPASLLPRPTTSTPLGMTHETLEEICWFPSRSRPCAPDGKGEVRQF